jgi:hypothetical protein
MVGSPIREETMTNTKNRKKYTKYSIKDLHDYAEKNGGTLVSETYVNSRTKYTWHNPRTKNTFELRWEDCIKHNRWDPIESLNIPSIEDLKTFALSKNGECLSTIYINSATKYKWKCNKLNNIWEATWRDIKRGSWNPLLKGEKISKSKTKYSIEDLKNFARTKNGECLSEKYESTSTKYKWKCNLHDCIWEATWFWVKKKTWCPICATEKVNKDNTKYNMNNLHSYAKRYGGECLSTKYIDTNHKYIWYNPKTGSKWEMSWHSIKRGYWDPLEGNTTSLAEIEILNWIQKFYPNAAKKQFNELNIENSTKEIDIYIPELNIGIEYCGLYWHSEIYKEKNYHYNKMKKCKTKGIQLITIFEDEWLSRQKQLKNFLLSKLNKNHTKIYARKCKIKEVEKNLANKFLNENHIQGKARYKIAFGLYYNDELIGLITGDKHHRQNQEKIFVLNRLVFKSGITVIGGASKLIKKLTQYAKDNNYIKIISWSDNRISEGNVYETTGWSKTEELSPDYSYYIGSNTKRKSKQSCQKKKLLKLGATGNTEKEMANSLGYYRIWDCGKIRWEIKL